MKFKVKDKVLVCAYYGIWEGYILFGPFSSQDLRYEILVDPKKFQGFTVWRHEEELIPFPEHATKDQLKALKHILNQ